MRNAIGLFLGALMLGGCAAPDEPLVDKGRGRWVAMDAPSLAYRAVWGASASDVVAVGDGGIARFDGESWSPAEDVPDTVYRAVWGRSSGEVWVGGDGALLARMLGGWQEQALWHRGVLVEDYSVVALSGSARGEFAIVQTGGVMLLFRNEGAFWSTLYWNGGNAPRLPQGPALIDRGWSVLVAGDGDLVECRRDEIGLWSATRWTGADDLPHLAALSGGWNFWSGAGGANVAMYRVDTGETVVLEDDRPARARRDAHGVAALAPHHAYVAGQPIELLAPDPISGVLTSPIEACDQDGCALEAVPAPYHTAGLRAVWATSDGTAFAVGPKGILRRQIPAPIVAARGVDHTAARRSESSQANTSSTVMTTSGKASTATVSPSP